MYLTLVIANQASDLTGMIPTQKACMSVIMSVHNFNTFGKYNFKIVANHITLNSWTNFRVVPHKRVYQYDVIGTYANSVYYISADTYDELSWLERGSFKKSDLCQVDAIPALRHFLKKIK